MQTICVWVGLVIVVSIILAVLVSRSKRWRDWKRKRAQAKELGFTPLGNPTQAQKQQIIELYRDKTRIGFDLHNLASKTFVGGELWLFDLSVSTSSGYYTLAERGVAVIAKDLWMPAFWLAPRQTTGGSANRFFSWAYSFSGAPVDFSDYPAFARHYTVVGDQANGIRDFLDESRLTWLAGREGVALQAGRNCFAYSHYFGGNNNDHTSASVRNVSQTVDEAMELYRLFSQPVTSTDHQESPDPGGWAGVSRCPQCGAEIKLQPGVSTAACTYCGTQLILDVSGAKAPGWQVQEKRLNELHD
jgi:hypothetical protein